MIRLEEERTTIVPTTKIKVIGVGGAGGNIINSMVDSFPHIEFIAANTDAQALNLSKAQVRIQLGLKATKGLGTGANPDLGKRSAEEDLEKIIELVQDSDIVFLAGGLGGGTGSGALPVIAQALQENNILSITLASKPFVFEGRRRAKIAQDAFELLKKYTDTLLIIPNQKLLELVDKKPTLVEAFNIVNETIAESVRSISDIITKPGQINVDFADIKSIMKRMGLAVMGTGRAHGEDRAIDATMAAINSPLLENMSIDGARSILLSISGNDKLGLEEVSAAASIIYQKAHEDANIILGSVIDNSLEDDIIITVIATGFEQQATTQQSVARMTTKPALKEQVEEIERHEKQSAQFDNLDIPAALRRSGVFTQNSTQKE
ncbi:MAG: Cell division protein FtsZ [candidate division TM6 bacterium GW2011_GWE2_41_16]|nr:MAG: Cell division protein FtsZ [candidate division TM6 bacterium GW2011_GWE2_41_16]